MLTTGLRAILFVTTAGWAASVAAQTTEATQAPVTPAEASETSALADIVVTAQRRAENLQDVPVSVAVASAAQLEAANVTNLQGLSVLVPTLSFNAIQSFALPRIRGIGSSTAGPGVESDVSIYVDGVYYASATAALFTLNNVEQVSVLKGPQGTLFGRNSTAGLIQVTTRDPSDGSRIMGSLGYGNYDIVTGNLYVGGPISGKVAADLAASIKFQGNGFGRNITLNRDTRRTKSDLNFRSKIVLNPFEGTTLTLIGDYSDSVGTQGTIRLEPGTRPNPAVGPAYGGSVWDVAADFEGVNNIENYGGSVSFEQELGSVTFSSITAYRELNYQNQLDLDVTATPFQRLTREQHDEQFTQEFQLQSAGSGPFVWTIGAFYFDAQAGVDPYNISLLGRAVPPNGLNRISTIGLQKTTSYAGYGQAAYTFASDTTITAGVRYTDEKRRGIVSRNLSFANGNTAPGGASDASISFDKLTFRLSVDQKLDADSLVYASFNRGFKSGGYNVTQVGAPAFLPAVLDAYEVGAKTSFADRRVQLNAALFYYDYNNIQVQRIQADGTLGIINGAKAQVYGLDADLSVAVGDNFRVNAGIGLLDTKFKDFPNAPIGTLGGGVPVTTGDVSGNELPVAPGLTSNLGADYNLVLASGGRINFNAAVTYNSGWFTEPDNIVEQDDFVLVNGRVRYVTPDERFNLSVWTANLTNSKVRGNAITLVSGSQVASFDPPRTYGVTFGFNF